MTTQVDEKRSSSSSMISRWILRCSSCNISEVVWGCSHGSMDGLSNWSPLHPSIMHIFHSRQEGLPCICWWRQIADPAYYRRRPGQAYHCTWGLPCLPPSRCPFLSFCSHVLHMPLPVFGLTHACLQHRLPPYTSALSKMGSDQIILFTGAIYRP